MDVSFMTLNRTTVLKLFCDPELKHVDVRFLLYCIIRANFKNNIVTDKLGRETLIHRGSFCTSSKIIMKDLRIKDWRTYNRIRDYLKYKGYLNYYSNNSGTYFHVKNYNDYVAISINKKVVNYSSTTCERPEQINIYTQTENKLKDPKREEKKKRILDCDLTTPSGAVQSYPDIPFLDGGLIRKDSDYFKSLENMYGNTLDVWGELHKLFKVIKVKELKISNLEGYLESALRKKSDVNVIRALSEDLKEKKGGNNNELN